MLLAEFCALANTAQNPATMARQTFTHAGLFNFNIVLGPRFRERTPMEARLCIDVDLRIAILSFSIS